MISRKTSRTIAEVYAILFRQRKAGQRRNVYPRSHTYYTVDTKKLYDFLYDSKYSAWFCNKARAIKSYSDTRPLKDFIMKLHTGETQHNATPNRSWEERRRLGQIYLVSLAEDVLNYWHNDYDSFYKKETTKYIEELAKRLELDGYTYENSRLLTPEEDVLDVQEEAGLLKTLFSTLGLDNQETAFHHLNLSEEHYLAERWDDAISNSRKFLECVLQEVAAAHSVHCRGTSLPENTYTRPVRVRDYLESEGLVEKKEKETIAKVYGLLSQAGGHPYMARNDQARLLRHLALTFSQFVMLRFRGSVAG